MRKNARGIMKGRYALVSKLFLMESFKVSVRKT
jgi:hypothetical protein